MTFGRKSENFTISQSQDIYCIMKPVLEREKNQKKYNNNIAHFWVISLNNAKNILSIALVSEGSMDKLIVKPMDVVRVPLLKNATGVVFVRNHLSGIPEPSQNDKDITAHLIQACKLMEITVYDHVIITDNTYYSFSASGLLETLANSSKYMFPYDVEKLIHGENEANVRLLNKEAQKKIKESLDEGV